MANKLPNEQELLSQLSNEKVVLSADIWNLIYTNIEDGISVIRLLLTFYLGQNQAVPLNEVRKISQHINDVSAVFRKLINPQIIKTEDKGFIRIKEENKTLHPIIKSMFSHYIGNDVQAINFIVGYFIDEEKPLDSDYCKKVFDNLQSMEEFLGKLKNHTETLNERIKNELTLPMIYLRNMREKAAADEQTKIDKCIASLEEINRILDKKQA